MEYNEEISFDNRKLYVYLKVRDRNNIRMFLIQDGQMFRDVENNIIEKIRARLDNIVLVLVESKDRNSEYSPWFSKSSSRKIPYFSGGGDAYLRLLMGQIKPFIQRRYNIRVKGEDTFLCGASLGGLIASYGLLKYPRELGGGIFVSPSYWYEGFLDYLGDSRIDFSRFKIYLDVGDREGRGRITRNMDMKEVVSLGYRIFIKRGLCEDRIKFLVQEEMVHNESFFIDRIYDGISYIMNGKLP